MSEIRHLISKDITPHAVLSHIQSVLDQIDQIYVVTKCKDGNWQEHHCGDLFGLNFATLIMQKHALEVL